MRSAGISVTERWYPATVSSVSAATEIYRALLTRPGASLHYSTISGLSGVYSKTVLTYLSGWTNPTYSDPRFPGIRRDGGGYYAYVGGMSLSGGGSDQPSSPHERMLACLDGHAPALVAQYFRNSGGFAGRTFDMVGENPTNRVVTDDLLALNCLDELVPARSIRALLRKRGQREISDLLRSIDPQVRIGSPKSASQLEAAERAWVYLRAIPGFGSVLATKLLSRKRPLLVPIVDRVVRVVVAADSSTYWSTFDSFMAQHGAVVEDVRSAADLEDVTLLRVLDVCIWMRGSRSKRAYRTRDKLGVPDLSWAPRPGRQEQE